MSIKMSCEETVINKYEVDFTAEDVREFKQYVLSFSYAYEPILKNAVLTTIAQDIEKLTFHNIVTAFESNNIQWSNQYRIVYLRDLVKEFMQLKLYKFHPHDLSNVIEQDICYWTEE